MIIDMRTYTYHPSTYRTFLKYYREEGYKITSTFLGFNLGLFTTSSGIVNKTVQWFAYDNHDHRDQCRHNYLTSPRKINFTDDADKLIRQQESRVLVPTNFSPLKTIDPTHPLLTAPDCEKRIFEFNTYVCRPGHIAAAVKSIEAGLYPEAKKNAEWVIAYFSSDSGQERVYELRAYSSLQSRMERNGTMQLDAAYREAMDDLCEHLIDTDSVILDTMPMSPLH